jgi:hypothetical protein
MDDAVHQRVRAHDQYQVEFKLDYQLSPAKRTRYQITTYLFVPPSLAIRSDTYSKSEFYRDIQNYVRLQTPLIPLNRLRSDPDSPLVALTTRLTGKGAGCLAKAEEEIVANLKFLRAILKSSLRLELRRIRRVYGVRLSDPVEPGRVRALVLQTQQEAEAIIAHFRQLGQSLSALPPNHTVLLAYQLADESLSLVYEEFLLSLFRLVSQPRGKASTELERCVEKAVRGEVAYRQRTGYGALIQPEGDNETYLHRTSMLKKYVSSVLYLSATVEREGTALEQVLLALAAGLSMIFATVVAFYFQLRYGHFTFPVFVALVVGYMFKDRIKESARSFFAHSLRHFIFDRRIIVRTRDGKQKLGYLREKLTYPHVRQVPPHVLALRNHNLNPELVSQNQDETVLCYTKEVVLRADAFRRMDMGGPEITGITDIMRYDVRPYLRKMDDPFERKFHLQQGKLCVARCQRVYYLNIISLYTSEGSQGFQRIERTRVALTRKGIKRIERDVGGEGAGNREWGIGSGGEG